MGLSSSAIYLLSTLLLLCISKSHAQNDQVFDIMNFGGKSDGKTNNSQALSMAWEKGCGYDGSAVVLIPQGTFLVFPMKLEGPCHGSIKLQIDGNVLAPHDKLFIKGEYWLALHQVNNLIVDGQGGFDGQGSSAWGYRGHDRPITLKFTAINNATIRNIKSVDSKFFHFAVHESENMTFDNVTLIAPKNSSNTDGIHISKSTNINIFNSVMSTGDDCISIGHGSQNINITNVQCGPGHGISIGSLGQDPKELNVTKITVRHSIFKNTKNGVRIKSWSTPNPSIVTKVSFIHLQMENVENPIIIDQNYCPHCSSNHQHQLSMSRVQIEDVRYEDIRGTSNSKEAVIFNCSLQNPCQSIVLQDINLTFNNHSPNSTCHNVMGSAFGVQLPPPCFSPETGKRSLGGGTF